MAEKVSATSSQQSGTTVGNLDPVLVSAVYQARWADVGRLLERGVSDASHRWTVKIAGERLEGGALANYILPHSDNDQLDELLPVVVRRGQWWVVGQLLKRGVGDEAQRTWAVQEAGRRVGDTQLAAVIVPYATLEQASSLLTAARERDMWESVSVLLKREIAVTRCQQVIEEACRRAPDSTYTASILSQCHDDQLASVFSEAVRRHLWLSVTQLLERSVDSRLRMWAVEEVVQHGDTSQQAGILPQCAGNQLDFATRFCVQRGMWASVGQLLGRGLDPSLHNWAVSQCCCHGDGADLMKHILPHCSDEQIISVLKTATVRNLWDVVASLLFHGSVTDDQRQELFLKAGKHATETCLIREFLPVYPDACLHLLLPEMARRKFWGALHMLLQRGLTDDQRKWIMEKAICNAPLYHLNRILPACCMEHFESLFMMAVKQCCWDGVAILLRFELTDAQRGWAVEKVIKVAKEPFLIAEVLNHCTSLNTASVLDIMVSRQFWKAVAFMLKSRDVSLKQTVRVWEEACRTANEGTLCKVLDVRYNCPDECLHTVLMTVLHRQFWKCVTSLFWRNISDEDRKIAFVKVYKSAKEYNVRECLKNHTGFDVDALLTVMVKRRFWGVVGTIVSQNVSTGQYMFVVKQACKHAPETDLLYNILEHCPSEIAESVLETVLQREWWIAVGYILSHHSISESLRAHIMEKACSTVGNQHTMWKIFQYCPDGKVEWVVGQTLKRGHWYSLGPLMKRQIPDSLRLSVVETALSYMDNVKRAENFRERHNIRCFIRDSGAEQVDFVMHEYISSSNWHRFCQMVDMGMYFHLPEDVTKSSICHASVAEGVTFLYALCFFGLWKTFSFFVREGTNFLSTDSYGRSLLSFAVACRTHPEKLVAECIKLGLSTHQPKITSEFKNNNIMLETTSILGKCVLVASPLQCAIIRSSTVLTQALYETGASSPEEINKVYICCVLECALDDDLDDSQKEVKDCLEKLATTPRRLKSSCRLVISHHLGVGAHREEGVKHLPLPENLQDYVLFSDIVCQLREAGPTCKKAFNRGKEFSRYNRLFVRY